MSNITGQLEFKINDEWAQFVRKNSWVSFIPEFAKDVNGQEFMRGRGHSIVYRIKTENEKGEQTYECTRCHGEILSTRVAHAIWGGPFPLSGHGRCNYEIVPYCPNCEKKPDFHGSPIQVS